MNLHCFFDVVGFAKDVFEFRLVDDSIEMANHVWEFEASWASKVSETELRRQCRRESDESDLLADEEGACGQVAVERRERRGRPFANGCVQLSTIKDGLSELIGDRVWRQSPYRFVV
jgi:hypothetical protein